MIFFEIYLIRLFIILGSEIIIKNSKKLFILLILLNPLSFHP